MATTGNPIGRPKDPPEVKAAKALVTLQAKEARQAAGRIVRTKIVAKARLVRAKEVARLMEIRAVEAAKLAAKKAVEAIPLVPIVKPGLVKSRRHPFLDGWPKNKWNPDAVGKVRSYPATLEAFEKLRDRSRIQVAEIRARNPDGFTRRGVPNGMARRSDGAKFLRALGRHEAVRIHAYMKQEGLLLEPDNKVANDALLVAIELSRDPMVDPKLKLAAARVVLEWTQAKPAAKSEVTVARKAEDFLLELAAEALPITRD